MPDILEGYRKQKEYLICVDSDGCAMDTMDSKHITCFGPCLIPVWGLSPWEQKIRRRWDEINLYTMTRGINRFKGLAMILAEIDRTYKAVPDVDAFVRWTGEAPELSNQAVKAQWELTGKEIFRQALEWSEEVNRKIGAMPEEAKCAFDGVREALKAAHETADVAVVSSANKRAVEEEWQRQGLMEYVDVVLSQDAGSKSACINALLKKGYCPDHVLMVGDAPGDCEAAADNGVYYYPILVKHEEMSWRRFPAEALKRLVRGEYGGAWQEQMVRAFRDNLS